MVKTIKAKLEQNNILIFCLLSMLYLIAVYILSFNQASMYKGLFVSDFQAYYQTVQGVESYQYPYPIFFLTIKAFSLFCDTYMAASSAVVLFCGLNVVAMYFYVNRFLQNGLFGFSKQTIATFATFCLLFVGAIPLSTNGFWFVGIYSPNSWHNQTYFAARPFVVLSFFAAFYLLKRLYNDEKPDAFNWIATALTSLVCVMTKPSFAFVLLPFVAIMLLAKAIKTKFKSFKDCFVIGLAFIPTIIALLYQYVDVFESEQSMGGIGFALGKAWHIHNSSILLALVGGLLFPIVVAVFNLQKFKSFNAFSFAWGCVGVSLVESLVLYEKGYRLSHGNFMGGYMCAMIFVFTLSLTEIINQTATKRRYLLLAWLAFLIQLVFGIIYFFHVFMGGVYT